MPQPYVVRFVSLESGAGKTRVAAYIVKELKALGYAISVIKHCASGITLEDKDSSKYLEHGADYVVLSSPRLAVVYVTGHSNTLESALAFTKTPVVVVEGFRESRVGDAVLVVGGVEDLKELLTRVENVLAVVSRSETPGQLRLDIPCFKVDNAKDLVSLIESRIKTHFYAQTPRTNCGMCGYSSCSELVENYLKGKANWCPLSIGVEIVVDGYAVPLNPFVKNIFNSVIKGFLEALKGVPRDYRELRIYVREERES